MQERSGTLRRIIVALVLGLALGALLAPSALAAKKPKKVRDTTTWLCKPGLADNPCAPGFATTLISPTGGVGRTANPKPDPDLNETHGLFDYPQGPHDNEVKLHLRIGPHGL